MQTQSTIRPDIRARGQIPGPRGHALLGNIPEIRRDILGAIEAARSTYGDLIQLRLGPKALFVACSPELAEEILVRQRSVFLKIGMNAPKPVGLQLLLGNGLLTNRDYDSWLAQRRLIQPAFHRRSVADLAGSIGQAGLQMLDRWQAQYPPGQAIDIAQEMMRVTLDVIGRTMFGADVLEQATTIGRAVQVGTEFVSRRTQSPLKLPVGLPTPGNLAFRRARRDLDGVIYAILDRRLADGERHDDLLDMLITARDADTGQGMTREQLRDEMATIFLAGHETTANTLAWTWYLLAQHPAALRRLQDEVDQVLGGRTPTMQDLHSLPYTAAVFDEALRLFPAAPLLTRRTNQPTVLGGYRLPANAQLFVSIYSIQRHPNYWDAPELFRPERFLGDPPAGRHPLAHMPFGAGQRMCVGASFAEVEGQLLLALIAQRYELRLAPGRAVEREVAITFRPRGGLWMTPHPRNTADLRADEGATV